MFTKEKIYILFVYVYKRKLCLCLQMSIKNEYWMVHQRQYYIVKGGSKSKDNLSVSEKTKNKH